MKTSISIGSAYYNGEDWDDLVDYTVKAEQLGVDQVWSAEAWGMDAIVPLAFIAAKTEKIKLGTGILQISARVPSMIAMTAQSLAWRQWPSGCRRSARREFCQPSWTAKGVHGNCPHGS